MGRVRRRGGRVLFQVFPYLTVTRGHPYHIYSDSMPTKQLIGQMVIHNKKNISSFEGPDSTVLSGLNFKAADTT